MSEGGGGGGGGVQGKDRVRQLEHDLTLLRQKVKDLERQCEEEEEATDRSSARIRQLEGERMDTIKTTQRIQEVVSAMRTTVTDLIKELGGDIDPASLAASMESTSLSESQSSVNLDAECAGECASLEDAIEQLQATAASVQRERDEAVRVLDQQREEVKQLRDLVDTYSRASEQQGSGRDRAGDVAALEGEVHELRLQLAQATEERDHVLSDLEASRRQQAELEQERSQLQEALATAETRVAELYGQLDTVDDMQSFAAELQETEGWKHLSLDEQRHIIRKLGDARVALEIAKDSLAGEKHQHVQTVDVLQRLYLFACDRERKLVSALDASWKTLAGRRMLQEARTTSIADKFGAEVNTHSSSYAD